MPNAFLLDTNAVIGLLNREPELIRLISEIAEVYVPAIVIGEFYFGAENSGRVEANLKRVDEFVAGNTILNCDVNTARVYGRVERQLRVKGRRIPENDIWIASVALQYQLTLLTRDAHFDAVENLSIQSW
jgi:tRNA(fMet)-specific endonuclease VapC